MVFSVIVSTASSPLALDHAVEIKMTREMIDQYQQRLGREEARLGGLPSNGPSDWIPREFPPLCLMAAMALRESA